MIGLGFFAAAVLAYVFSLTCSAKGWKAYTYIDTLAWNRVSRSALVAAIIWLTCAFLAAIAEVLGWL